MRLSIAVGSCYLLAFVVGTRDRGTYERMLLYDAYIAEEFVKTTDFIIAPGCVGSRVVPGIAGGRCTFLEFIKDVWAPTNGGQQTMPGAGPEPSDTATDDEKKNWYRSNLGSYFKNGGTETKRVGLKPEQDGQNFASYFKDASKRRTLEQTLVKLKWDQWMSISKLALGATSYPEVMEKVGDVLSSSRSSLLHGGGDLSSIQSSTFNMAQDVGDTVENLRFEDFESHRTGRGENLGKGDLFDRLLSSPEFKAAGVTDANGQLTEKFKDFKLEVTQSPVAAKIGSQPWFIFDGKATAAKWVSEVPNIRAIIRRVNRDYKLEPRPKDHLAQINAIRETNRNTKNWGSDALAWCQL